MHLARYRGRFGGAATIVTLDDGRAFTAAHCIAAVDGRPGTIIASADGCQWRVVRRWLPRGLDLAVLAVAGSVPPSQPRQASGDRVVVTSTGRLARRAVLRPGVEIAFFGFTGRRFQARRARVTSVTATRAVAEVLSPAGVRTGDSGGPVLVGGVLAGIVIARAGKAVGFQASREIILARIEPADDALEGAE